MKIYSNQIIQNKYLQTRQSNVVNQTVSNKDIDNSILSVQYNDYNLMFKAKQTITEKINLNKTKILKNLKEIASTYTPKLTNEEKILIQTHKKLKTIRHCLKRIEDLLSEAELIEKNVAMHPYQRQERLIQILKEIKILKKLKTPNEEQQKKTHENYDYALINRFLSEIMEDNFNLQEVYFEHYESLNSIETIGELKEKYPYLKIPSLPTDVVAKKCVNVLNRDFYIKLNELIDNATPQDLIMEYISDSLIATLDKEAINSKILSQKTINNFATSFLEQVLSIYSKLKSDNNFNIIPTTRPQNMSNITALDYDLLQIDYDKFVLGVLRQQYLEGKKLNEIKYVENDFELLASDLKNTEYKFEKSSEKIKKIINDAKKIEIMQRDYNNFNIEELNARLNFYANSSLGDNNDILDIIIDFDYCQRTPEDIKYMIQFLKELDYIADNKLDDNASIELIKNKNLRPHGTDKINIEERRKKEELKRIEHQNALKLKEYKQSFDDMIMMLYKNNLASVVEYCLKYSPKTLEENEIQNFEKLKQIVMNNINKKQTLQQLESEIIQWDFYNEESKNKNKSEIFIAAEKYGNNFEKDEREYKIGQYLWNADFVLKYPENKELFSNTKILDLIMEKYNNNKDLAIQLLCKYENYKLLKDTERNSIIKIIEIFDNKNENEKFLLKNIIENEYLFSDTIVIPKTDIRALERTFASSAKQQIMGKYKFPDYITYFKAFEESLSYDARSSDSSGVKKVGRNNKKLKYKIEAKLAGLPDRLFSSKNNYYFDIYSDLGLH